MVDTTERVRRVKLRAEELRIKKESRLLGALSALCAVLSLSLIERIGNMTGGGYSNVPELYGTMLLNEDAGGYVLVGVISFSAAVFITVQCLRVKEKKMKQETTRTKEK